MGNQNFDRRSFLKGAAATAATVIGSNLASGTQARRQCRSGAIRQFQRGDSRFRPVVGKNHRQARF